MRTLAESPSGLVHGVTLHRSGRGVTGCGRVVDWETWSRISTLDHWMFGKGRSTVARAIELPKCERCFS